MQESVYASKVLLNPNGNAQKAVGLLRMLYNKAISRIQSKKQANPSGTIMQISQ